MNKHNLHVVIDVNQKMIWGSLKYTSRSFAKLNLWLLEDLLNQWKSWN